MRVSEEPVYIYLFRQSPVFTSLHLRSPVHVVPPQISSQWESHKNRFAFISSGKVQFLPPCIWDLPFMSYRLRFPAYESPRRTGLHRSLSGFYLLAFEISRSCRSCDFSLLCISLERDAVQAGSQAGGEPLPAGRPRRQSGQRGVSQALQEQSRSLSINNNIRKNWVKKIPNQE